MMMRLLAAAVLVVLATAMSQPPANYVEPAPVLATAPSLNFRATTGSGVVENPANTFAIPRCGAGKLGYVVTPWPEPMVGAVMRIEYTVEASADAAIVGYENRDQAGRLALYFQRDRMDYSLRKYNRGYRWWSRSRVVLVPGSAMFEVPLVKDRWTGGGTQEQRYWDAARNDVEGVGFTLGDNHSAGHGVCMKAGSAKITVEAFSVR